MTDDKKPDDKKPDDKRPDDKPTSFGLGELRALVKEVVDSVVTTGKETKDEAHKEAASHTENRLDRSSRIADEVQREVAAIQEREKRANRDKEIDTTLKTLVEKTAEKPPVERRRVHKIMGWGE